MSLTSLRVSIRLAGAYTSEVVATTLPYCSDGTNSMDAIYGLLSRTRKALKNWGVDTSQTVANRPTGSLLFLIARQ